jgi:hypothetical protein
MFLLNNAQNISLDFLKKPNLKKKDELDHVNIVENTRKLQDIMINYFAEKIKSDELSYIDNYLLKNLDNEMKHKIHLVL